MTLPSASKTPLWQRFSTVAMLWEMKSTVRPLLLNFTHLTQAFSLKCCVANSQYFIHEKNLRLQVSGHGKCQAHVHSTGIMLDRDIDELFNFGKSDDLVEFAARFPPSSCPGSRHSRTNFPDH